jgi:nucleolar MIF4G domain-containing protein 1
LDQPISPPINETQVAKKSKSSSKKKVAAEECALSEDEIGAPVVRKVKKGSQKSSKKKNRVEMGLSDISMAAQMDLELERKLSKKLKVKEGKLRGLDDGLNMLFEGMPSADDLFGDMEGFDSDELPRRKTKKSSSSKKRKLSKEEMETEGPVEARNQDAVFEEVPDSGTSWKKKKDKKRKLSSQEQEDGAEDDAVCIDKPVESSGADMTLGDAAADVSEKKVIGKYIAPHLRGRAGNEPEEHTQIRRRVRGRKGGDFVLILYF